MTTSVKNNIKTLNKLIKTINVINNDIDQSMNVKEYDRLMNDRIDVIRLARSIANDIIFCIDVDLEIEATAGHMGTSKTISEIKDAINLK